MKTPLGVGGLVLLAALLSGAQETDPIVITREGGVESGAGLLLTEKDRLRLEAQALDGSAPAAYRLFLHHSAGEGGGDETKRRYWLQIGAENGSMPAQLALAQRLRREADASGDPALARRSCFWRKKAWTGGASSALVELRASGCPLE